MKQEQENYHTSGLYEAAFLYVRGAKLIGHSRDGVKTVLQFEGAGAKKLALEYLNGGMAPANKLFDAYHMLRGYALSRAK